MIDRSSSPSVADEFASVEAELNTRWPETKIDPTLDRIRALLDLLGDPQRAYPLVHVTGTNGKTSITRMVDSLLAATGLRTGRFISPHLQVVTERISVDGAPISQQHYVEAYRDIAPYVSMVDAVQPNPLSKFEVLVAMAYAAFADVPVDAAVVEVGLGGTWDSTNVADGRVAVIGPVGIDHVDYLGSDVVGIARDKAGIIKPDSVAVIAEQRPEVMVELLRRVADVDASVARAGQEFGVLGREIAVGGQLLRLQGLGGVYDEIFLPLHGRHQAENAAVALAATEAFLGAGAQNQLDVDLVREAFATVTAPGRLEPVR
ncbi:MAG TPA: Mur ligase family protein, partial [Nakamurella sp.]